MNPPESGETADHTTSAESVPSQTIPGSAIDSVECQEPAETPSSRTPVLLKIEDDLEPRPDGAFAPVHGSSHTSHTSTPPPSAEVKDVEVVDNVQAEEKKILKRKRAVSPPWQFGSVEAASLKSSDGRRVSARVYTGTPGTSESEGHANSASHSATRSRAASPPWKKFQADVPTSIQVDGKRKSGRVNRELVASPKRTSPRSKRLADKEAELLRVQAEAKKMGGKPMGKGTQSQNLQYMRSMSPTTKIEELQKQIAALKPCRSVSTREDEDQQVRSKRGRKRRLSSDEGSHKDRKSLGTPVTNRKGRGESDPEQSIVRPSPKIKLRFNARRDPFPPPHPNATIPTPSLPPRLSIFQTIDRCELQEMQQPYLETERGPPGAQYFEERNEKQATEEASLRRKLLKATEPYGALSKEVSSLYFDEQIEPLQQYGTHDHLVYHALYFRSLQQREHIRHRQLAKRVAQEALEYWKTMRGPTEEDIRIEQDKIFRLIYKQVVVDVRAKWEMVNLHVQGLRKARWEAEEDVRRQERLQLKIERSEKMVARQRGLDDSDIDMAENSGDDIEESDSGREEDDSEAGGGGGEEEEEEEEREENMTSSESDAEEDETDGETGQEMTEDELAAYLENQRRKEGEDGDENEEQDRSGTALHAEDGLEALTTITDQDEQDESADEEFHPQGNGGKDVNTIDEEPNRGNSEVSTRLSRPGSVVPTEGTADYDDGLSSDESIDMDDSDDTDVSLADDPVSGEGSGGEEADGEEEEEEGEDNDDDDPGLGLYGFLLSKKDLEGIGLPTPTTSADEGDERERLVEAHLDNNYDQTEVEAARAGAEESGGAETNVEVDQGAATPVQGSSEAQKTVGDNQTRTENAAAASCSEAEASPGEVKTLVEPPTLLRGTLRSYQHAGLDWLASLYRNGTNGILADEMGLGKTIQTIALLAHLAEVHNVWEPHLVIVPTSVLLNWVTEFQKFLPGFRVLAYYGSTDERAVKRKHWVNDPHHSDRSKRGYNVIITSYQTAMQDINAIRVVAWHYLVLDEAHNIRNFNSQRWQILIRLRTKARLLLTGTPLQNSLTELWALLTFLTAGDDDPAHGDLEEFLSHWKEPVKEIFDRGVTTLSMEAQKVVDQLHISLRPFLLRRLKTEVEKEMPKKTESVVVCKLSKRQRQLYQEYMGLAATRESLRRGNAVSAGKVLLSLRRVCNHPDLFDPRPIQTSLSMEQSALHPFEIKESLIRRMLGIKSHMPQGLMISTVESCNKKLLRRSRQLNASRTLREQMESVQIQVTSASGTSSIAECQALQRLRQRERKLQQIRSSISATERSLACEPVYGTDLREVVRIKKPQAYLLARGRPPQRFLRGNLPFGQRPVEVEHRSDWILACNSNFQKDILTLDTFAERWHDAIVRFAFCTPVVTAPILDFAIPTPVQERLRQEAAYPLISDYAHEARQRTSIVFPDKRLLVYDSGKLQRLTKLLRELQARGSRSLIFTQMTGTLNILEQFLGLLGLPYLRLDGSTPAEKRHLFSAEFNRADSKYQCMILSSRAGGVGLNLTGASSVIFYDLDWNPQMDRQCMDRAHRIGQVRDVEVYKLVSEKTVEENILRRANQKSLLDQTVIQQGQFTTDYQQPARKHPELGEDEDDVAAAIERFLGGGDKNDQAGNNNNNNNNQVMESVEDREDVAAAQAVRKELRQEAVDDFGDGNNRASGAATPGGGLDGMDEEKQGHIDSWMIQVVESWWAGVPYVPPVVRKLDKHGRDPSHRPKKKR